MDFNFDQLAENFRFLTEENVELREDLDRIRQQMDILKWEDQGWKALYGPEQYSEDSGFSLDTLKAVSKELGEEVAGSAYPKHANELRQSYTFGKGFVIPGVDQSSTPKAGRKSKLQAFWDHPGNQRYIFSKMAHTENHVASSTTGMLVWLGDNRTKTGRPIPFAEISAVYLNPDYRDEIWAYRRDWDTVDHTGKSSARSMWYMTDSYPENLPWPKRLGSGTESVPVSQDHTVIDLKFNAQTGWTFGVPDLLAGRVWNRKYLSMIKHGEEVSATLAFYSAKVRNKSRAGATNVGLQVAGAGSKPGATIAYGQDNEVDVFSSAGKTYDFGGLRIFAAIYAAAVGVPLTDLSADPSSAGASYGSAAALMPSARRKMEDRRNIWAWWYTRLFKWGTGEVVRVTPESIDETEPYRNLQSITLAYQSGLIHADEAREAYLKATGIVPRHDTPPEGFLLPNNKASAASASLPKQAASPDQGVKNGTGGELGKGKQDLLSQED